jgi:hypothetical protein
VPPFSLHRRSHAPLVVKHLFLPLLCLLFDQGRRGGATAPESKPPPPKPPILGEVLLRAPWIQFAMRLTSAAGFPSSLEDSIDEGKPQLTTVSPPITSPGHLSEPPPPRTCRTPPRRSPRAHREKLVTGRLPQHYAGVFFDFSFSFKIPETRINF